VSRRTLSAHVGDQMLGSRFADVFPPMGDGVQDVVNRGDGRDPQINRRASGPSRRGQSALMAASLTTLRYRSKSSLMACANSLALEPMRTTPAPRNFDSASGDRRKA